MALGLVRQVIIGATCNLLVIDSGLNEGWSTPIIPKFAEEDTLNVTENEIAWIVNVMYVGVGFGSIVPFLLMDRVGRKGVLLVATIPKFASWIIIGLANSVPQLLVGRILAGIGCGINYSVMPMYIGEVSSKKTRGPLGTLMAVLLNVGMLLAYAIGLYFSRFNMSMICACVPVLFGLSFVWLPESSVFLTKKNNLKSAVKTLQWSLGKENVEEELEEIKRIVAVEDQTHKTSFGQSLKDTCMRQENRRAFGIAVILLSALTLTGAAPILAYQSFIFKEAGFQVSTNLAVILTGVSIVLAGSVCVFLVRMTGKRLLLLISTPICVIALTCIAAFFTLLHDGYDVSRFNWVPMTFIMIYVLGFGLALNPVPLAYVGEIFSIEIKVPAAIFCALYYAVTTTTIIKYYQVLQETYGTHVPIWTFAGITFLLWILIYRYVPETEGKSLEEVQVELRKGK